MGAMVASEFSDYFFGMCFSRKRSEGFPFIVGGLGVGPVFGSRVLSRRLSFLVVCRRRVAVIPCLLEKLHKASFLEVSRVTLLHFAWQTWHFVTCGRV